MDLNNNLDQPIDRQTRYLYGINERLSVLIEQMSSLLDYIAKKEGIATSSSQVVLENPTVTETAQGRVERKTRKK